MDGGLGWSATALHAGYPGRPCRVFHGTAPGTLPAVEAGVVGCTRSRAQDPDPEREVETEEGRDPLANYEEPSAPTLPRR